jgi:Galactose oxidase, central domain/Kelch motif
MGPRLQRILIAATLSVLVLTAGWLPGSARALSPVGDSSPDAALQPSPRWGHTMTSAPMAGELFLFGGNASTGPSSELWTYNSFSMGNAWQLVVPTSVSPPARFYHAAALYNGELYVFGGAGARGAIYADVWTYHPRSNTWEKRASAGTPPEARYMHSATAFGDKIYIFGGHTAMALASTHMYIYDPATESWQQGASIPSLGGGRYGHGAVPTSYGVSIFGGFAGMGVASGAWTYVPRTDAWVELSLEGSSLGSLSLSASGFPPLGLFGTAWRGNTAWTFGGETVAGAESMVVAQITFASATNGRGILLDPLPLARADAQAVVLNAAGNPYMLVYGGRRGTPPTPVAEPVIYEVDEPVSSPTPTRTRTPTVTRTPTPTRTAVLSIHLFLPVIVSP